jgi:hypothetical protein
VTYDELTSQQSENPPTPPPVVKRSRRRLVLAIVGGDRGPGRRGIAVVIWKHDKAPGTAASAAAWQNGGGLGLSAKLDADAGLAMSFSLTNGVGSMKVACTDLQTDVRESQAYLRIPDQAAQAAWAEALSEFANGASDCLSGIDKNDAALVAKSSDEMFHGMALTIGIDRRLKQRGAA